MYPLTSLDIRWSHKCANMATLFNLTKTAKYLTLNVSTVAGFTQCRRTAKNLYLLDGLDIHLVPLTIHVKLNM